MPAAQTTSTSSAYCRLTQAHLLSGTERLRTASYYPRVTARFALWQSFWAAQYLTRLPLLMKLTPKCDLLFFSFLLFSFCVLLLFLFPYDKAVRLALRRRLPMLVLARLISPYRLKLSLASNLVFMTLRARWAAASRRMKRPMSYRDKLYLPWFPTSASTSLKLITPAVQSRVRKSHAGFSAVVVHCCRSCCCLC